MKKPFILLSTILGGVFVFSLAMTSIGHALTVNETITKNDGDLNPPTDQTITFTGLNSFASGDLTVTFRVRGDFNAGAENVTLDVDGESFGIWLDEDLLNDSIVGPVGDEGLGNLSLNPNPDNIGTATIPLSIFSGLVADNTLAFFFDYSGPVGNSLNDLAEVNITYSATPEPSTILLLGTGLTGLVAWRMRKVQA